MSNKMNRLIFLIGLTCIIQTGLTQRDVWQATRSRNPFLPRITPPIGAPDFFVDSAPAPRSTFGSECTGPNFEPGTCTPTRSRNPFLPTNTQRIGAPQFVVDSPTTKSAPGPTSKVGSECIGPDLKPGTCTPIAQCSSLIARLQANPNDDTFVNFLKFSNKKCDNEYSVVCCPKANAIKAILKLPRNTNEIPRKLPSMADGCGYVDKVIFARKIRSTRYIPPARDLQTFRILVVGGTDSRIGAWPWIALIGYNDGTSPSSFKCGGALITSRHVLTAAHCIRSDLSFVRLGEHDLSTETETNHVDVPVVKYVRHPQYNKIDGHNDIALLYLGQNVQFSEKITPICLPFESRLRSKDITGSSPFVAGWGRTMEGGKSANVLQELQINVFDNEICKDKYKKQGKFVSEEQFDSAVVCAGDLGGGKDTCQGDSGGPLMLPEDFENSKRFHLIGIVSYGIGCARPDVPGVYSRVTNFIEWIENGVADTP